MRGLIVFGTDVSNSDLLKVATPLMTFSDNDPEWTDAYVENSAYSEMASVRSRLNDRITYEVCRIINIVPTPAWIKRKSGDKPEIGWQKVFEYYITRRLEKPDPCLIIIHLSHFISSVLKTDMKSS